MPSTINADNGVSSGSAGLKSAADSSGVLSLQTNGTTAVTVDTSQNVGIGTSSPGSKLQVGDGTATPEVRVSGASTAGAGGFLRGYRGGSPSFYIGDLAPIAGGTGGGMTAYVYGANPFVFYTNGSETMRLDSSGNLLVGTTAVGATGINLVTGKNYSVYESANSSFLNIFRQSSSAATILANGYQYTSTANGFASSYGSSWAKSAVSLNYGAIIFYTDTAATTAVGTDVTPSERMRINSSGYLLVGTTSTSGNARLVVNNGNNVSGDFGFVTTLGSNCSNTSSYHYIAATGGADKFYVYGNGSAANATGSYGTISDIKLKENIVDATPKLADVMRLQVRNFNLKTEPTHKQIGFVAQEFEQVFPGMVDESPDRDANGNTLETTTKHIKTSVLVPILVKAIQELKAEVDSLKSQLAAKG